MSRVNAFGVFRKGFNTDFRRQMISPVLRMLQHKNPFFVRLQNLLWEFRLGISTSGLVDIDFPDAHYYAAMRYETINRILEFLKLRPSDILVDVGSGKGRVLCAAAQYRLQSVVGIELSKELCAIAGENIEKLRGRKSPIVIHNTLAQEYPFAEGTIFTLFNPFGPSTLNAVLKKLEQSIAATPRDVRVVYANPEHEDVLSQTRWLERYAYWDKNETGLEHTVIFYRSVPTR